MADYDATLSRVEHYFDRSATKVWERLTSDAPVSRIRQTVREGRDRMRALMLSRLGADLRGARVLDAGCGAGQMTAELAARGATVVAIDISPSLVKIAENRLPDAHRAQVSFLDGDMLDAKLGQFDAVVAMDSLIYYRSADIANALASLGSRCAGPVVFTVAPKTPLLTAFWYAGKLFPRSDRSPVMVPHSAPALITQIGSNLTSVDRISSGFYISECLEYRA